MKASLTITRQAYHLFQIEGISKEEQMAILRLLNTQTKKESALEESISVLITLHPLIKPLGGVAMYYQYLLSKGFRHRAQVSGDYSDLLKSAQAIDLVFDIAHKSATRIKNPKYHFARAYTYYLLASEGRVVDENHFRKSTLALSKALQSSQSPSLLWLKKEVNNFAKRNDLSIPLSISRL